MTHTFRTDCSDPRSGLGLEWLLTNSLGDYASGTVQGADTRRYHGLLAVQTREGRRMLISSLEDSVIVDRRQVPLSSRIHPGAVWPEGWRFLAGASCSHDAVSAAFRIAGSEGSEDEVILRRTTILLRGESRILVRYTLDDTLAARALGSVQLSIRPLLSGRDINHLYGADPSREGCVSKIPAGLSCGFVFGPGESVPTVAVQLAGLGASFSGSADWYYRIEYPVERERGYDWQEDLLMPGVFDAELSVDSPVWLTAGTGAFRDDPEAVWNGHFSDLPEQLFSEPLLEHLRRECGRFLITTDGEPVVPAGYHWFGPWGRDTLISLPGLTFCSGRIEEGRAVLRQIRSTVRDGLVPNLIGAGYGTPSYNSADASLWYMLAVHRFALAFPGEKAFIKKECWPVIKEIISCFARGTMPDEEGRMLVSMTEDGLLVTGSEGTQLTWMDASIDGVPVTPRHGMAVELNALWYDALCFAEELAGRLRVKAPAECALIPRLKKAFARVFSPSGADAAAMDGGLYDTVLPDGTPSAAIRPNQIFAAAVPFSPLTKKMRESVTDCVRRNLLTPFGLRTLAPSDPAYRAACRGTQAERDAAYHQGTAWPWLLGAYADAVVATARSGVRIRELLDTLTPLFTTHLGEAGIGSISEIFDGGGEHLPGGCIAQAWSVSEALRLLLLIRDASPTEFGRWAASLPCGAESSTASSCTL
ncbi:MAG: amylo-alpha-1,6-glucosidase [Mailhella sp.]|nr:amylo-alpha-1,6-glucosidase [Mailhella sp.]